MLMRSLILRRICMFHYEDIYIHSFEICMYVWVLAGLGWRLITQIQFEVQVERM